MAKKVSVIIPCYNATKWLPQCFLSLAAQTIGIDELELIFINDASTDDGKTWSMLQDIERAYPDSVIIINSEVNKRQGGARNTGLLYASGEYIAFLDSDDWVDEHIYENAYNRAKETGADIVQFNHYCCFEDGNRINAEYVMDDEIIHISNIEDRKKFLVSEKITYGCWNKLYKKELIDKSGVKYAENVIYEEPLFVYPLLYFGDTFATMSDVLYMYRQNPYGTMRSDMEQIDTIKQHAIVQMLIWNFMKNTDYFQVFYEEIKLYFLHTYIYESLLFVKRRGMEVPYSLYEYLRKNIQETVKDYNSSVYDRYIPMQMELYKSIRNGMTQEMFNKYIDKL